ncbi:non-homologous end-joining DNA ligase [Phytomonospora sp. NPDC050363]|uniref:non-homologous end-joining DNA ligase n=1 Tax=Phytomonospora sp. NPDC050363 TaxID=3155642 RepID=UPI0033EF0AE3
MPAERQTETIDGHEVSLSKPDKVMYPDAGYTKADVVGYYRRIAPIILPHLRDRPVTRIRYPNGTGTRPFYEKNAPAGTPDWVRLATLSTPGSSKGRDTADFPVVEDTATLVWLANLAALELHTTQWMIGDDGETRRPDRLVADLDPGEHTGIEDCVEVALLLRERLASDGLTAYAKSSGKKGLHICCPISGEQSDGDVSAYAKALAKELEVERPELVTANMLKKERDGKIFIDWSQNNAAKTTVAPYSLRGLGVPTVSAPMTWDEVEAVRELRFTPDEVFERVDEGGDLWEPMLERGPKVPEVEAPKRRKRAARPRS